MRIPRAVLSIAVVKKYMLGLQGHPGPGETAMKSVGHPTDDGKSGIGLSDMAFDQG